MKVLELFSGTQSIGKEFRKAGHEVLSIEINDKFTKPPYNLEQWTVDISDLRAKDIIKKFGYPDVIWASPLCTTHSIAAIYHHRMKVDAIKHLTLKELKRNSLLYPKSEKAKLHDHLLLKTLHLIQDLKPKYWFIENPRGGMRKSPLTQGLMYRYTVTYCQYGDIAMKPTDIWTNHPDPNFRPMCKNGDNCHESAPRGSQTGTQGKEDNTARSVIPVELCRHVVELCEE